MNTQEFSPKNQSAYSYLNANAAGNPTPSQTPSGSSPGINRIPGAPAQTHKYIDRKPDPRNPGKYIYIYELPNGAHRYTTENGRELKELPHLPPHRQDAKQYTHSTVNGMSEAARKELENARSGISRITERATPKQSYENLNNIHPTKHRQYVLGHDGKYYNISDFDEGYRKELQRHQETVKQHMKPHWEHIADALEKGLKVPDEVIDNYPIPSTRAHLQYLRAIHLPEFKNWFGDWEHEPFKASQVVDADGKPKANNHKYNPTTPKLFFHGTPQGGFSKFAKHKDKGFNLFGEGFYFTDSQKVAQSYADRKQGENGKHYRDEIRGFTDKYGKDEKIMSYGAVIGALENIQQSSAKAALEETDYPHIVEALKISQSGGGFDSAKFFEKYYDLNKEYDGSQDRDVEGIPLMLTRFIDEYTRISGMVPKKAGAQIYQTFLNIRNPFDMEARLLPSSFDLMKKAITKHFEDGKVNFHKLFDKWDDKERGEAYRAGFNTLDGTDAKTITWHHLLKLKHILKDHPKHKAVFARSGDNELTYTEMHYLLSAGNKDHGFMQKFANYLKRADYDGITYEGGWENPIKEKHNVWVAFNPNQIKDVSNKTFNPKDENIYKAFSRNLLKAFGINTTTIHEFTTEEQQLM